MNRRGNRQLGSPRQQAVFFNGAVSLSLSFAEEFKAFLGDFARWWLTLKLNVTAEEIMEAGLGNSSIVAKVSMFAQEEVAGLFAVLVGLAREGLHRFMRAACAHVSPLTNINCISSVSAGVYIRYVHTVHPTEQKSSIAVRGVPLQRCEH